MWIRTGLFLGQAKAGKEAEFRTLVDTELADALLACPGVNNVRVLWARRRDESAPDVLCQIVMEFDSHEDIDAMLASEERKKMRSGAVKILELFSGTLAHVDYEVA